MDPLVARCLAGEEDAWEALWKRCAPRVEAALRAQGIRDPEEACQDLFARLWEDREKVLGGFQGRCSMERYLAVIALRRTLRQKPVPGPLPEGLQAPIPAEKPELPELEPREAVLVQLVYIDGLMIKEAAEVLGLTPGHARIVLKRMRDRISL